MIALNPALSVLVYATVEDTPWFLVLRPRAVWTDEWEPLRGEALPNESLPAAALRIAGEAGLASVERVLDVHRGRFEHAFAVRVEAPEGVRLDSEAHDDARWVPFHAAASLLAEGDKRALRKLDRILDVFLRRIEVVVEEVHDEGGCSGGGCGSSGGGCGSSSGGGGGG